MSQIAEKELDRRLVCRARQGDSQAWDQLVDRHARLVMAITRSYGLPDEERADAFQNAFIELHRNLAVLEEVESLPAWLRKVSSRICLKAKEKGARYEPLAFEEDLADSSPDSSLEGQLLRDEERHLVRLALERLNGRCQELIHRLFLADPPLSYQEAAESLGYSIGSIGALRQRCLASLEKILLSLGVGSHRA